MSWDIFVQDIPPGLTSVEDMPDDFVPKSLGTRGEIIARICALIPSADFVDPAWGKIDGSDFSIEVSMGSKDEVSGFAFHVRGGDKAAFVVAEILQELGLRAFDASSENGLFSIEADASEAQKRWREYRNRIISR